MPAISRATPKLIVQQYPHHHAQGGCGKPNIGPMRLVRQDRMAYNW